MSTFTIALPEDIDSYPTVAELCRRGCTLSQVPCELESYRYKNLCLNLPIDAYGLEGFCVTDPARIETMQDLEQWCERNYATLDSRLENAD